MIIPLTDLIQHLVFAKYLCQVQYSSSTIDVRTLQNEKFFLLKYEKDICQL
jgi:hypothetical protein